MKVPGILRRLGGSDGLPDGFPGSLDTDERVLAVAQLPGSDRHLVATSLGLWLPTDSGVRLVLVEAQVAELKARLQRTNPMEEADAYHQLFGDLVPLEQYRIALREKALR